jgi:hypothetical protein
MFTSNHLAPNTAAVKTKSTMLIPISSRYTISDGSEWHLKNPTKKTKHPFVIVLEPHNHSVSVRE